MRLGIGRLKDRQIFLTNIIKYLQKNQEVKNPYLGKQVAACRVLDVANHNLVPQDDFCLKNSFLEYSDSMIPMF